MSVVRGHDTAPKLIVRKVVWKAGLRYRVNDRRVYGGPYMTFSRVKLVVFCDDDYWHSHNWVLRGYKDLNDELSHYKPFRAEKIRRNVGVIAMRTRNLLLKDGMCCASGRGTFEMMSIVV